MKVDAHKLKSECYSPSPWEGALAVIASVGMILGDGLFFLRPLSSASGGELRFEFSIAVLKLFYQVSIGAHKLKSECYSPSLWEGALAVIASVGMILGDGLFPLGRGFSRMIAYLK